jgi:hypothetical protein
MQDPFTSHAKYILTTNEEDELYVTIFSHNFLEESFPPLWMIARREKMKIH